MNLSPVLLIIWVVLAVCFLGLLMYRGQITRYEDEQLFLTDGIQKDVQEEQSKIVRRVKQLEPLVRVVGGAAALTTALIIGLKVWTAWQSLQ